jgi:Putative phage serine protease XkdF
MKQQAASFAYQKGKEHLAKGFFKNVKDTAANASHASSNAAYASYHGAKAAEDAAVITRRVRRATGPVGAAAAAGVAGAGYYGGTKHKKNKARLKKLKSQINKVELTGELSKLDPDKRQVFGWASITKIDGQDVFDRQGDYIALEEIEKSAYHYVHNSRAGGNMHQRAGEVPLKVSDMVESFVVTPEKLEKMGLESNALPHGWWVGYQINDEDLWQEVKDGKKLSFSIHGKGVRTPMEA